MGEDTIKLIERVKKFLRSLDNDDDGRPLDPADVPIEHKYETAADAISDLVAIFGRDRLIEIIREMED